MNSVIKNLDIRGKMCPMTFVYTKLELEKMESGAILKVLLDFLPALKNIPDSCRRQNLAKVIDKEQISNNKNEWILTLKKI